LLVFFRFAADFIIKLRISFYGSDGIQNIQFEGMTQLPFVQWSRIMGIEIIKKALLVQGNEDINIGWYELAHKIGQSNEFAITREIEQHV
jgi:hypothetical protein